MRIPRHITCGSAGLVTIIKLDTVFSVGMMNHNDIRVANDSSRRTAGYFYLLIPSTTSFAGGKMPRERQKKGESEGEG